MTYSKLYKTPSFQSNVISFKLFNNNWSNPDELTNL